MVVKSASGVDIAAHSGGVTTPKGFVASGIHVGVKRQKKDLALVYSHHPCVAAGVFTTNKVQAAPVVISRDQLKHPVARAIVVNSGNANVCNGERGFTDAWSMVHTTASALGISPDEVIVASTGVIGYPLPIDKIEKGIPEAARVLDENGGSDAALAIMTTDTRPKEVAVRVTEGDRAYYIGAMAKGSGMIHPNMATMLAFITTDAAVDKGFLQESLKAAVDVSFNLISVDGDTSTNDSVIVLANGAAGGDVITAESEGASVFTQALTTVCIELAKMIAADGEGATKLVEVRVEGAKSVEDARDVVRSVTRSPLVKTAIHGNDANWGRILCAAGYSGAEFDPERASVYLGDVKVCENGVGLPFDEEAAAKVLRESEVVVRIDLGAGDAEATGWTCDLSADYVRINGGYRT